MQNCPPHHSSLNLETIVELPRGQVLTLTVRQPIELICRSGHIWLSVSGRDIVLRSAQRFVVPRAQAVVMEALNGDARIAFTPSRPAAHPHETANVTFEVGLPAWSSIG